MNLHCSASSCYGELAARPASSRKPEQVATSSASWRSAGGDDDVSSISSLKREVRSLLRAELRASISIALTFRKGHTRCVDSSLKVTGKTSGMSCYIFVGADGRL